MNNRRLILAVLTFGFVGLNQTYDFAVMLKTESESRAFHVEQQQAKARADRERLCKAKYPRSAVNRLECVR